ncbi:MAG TPA: Uma2 family endonuclease [Phycisphaerae bacterium]|nr:Uma2 family endonuclease [Phycisphaerae bacterium]
MTTTDKPSAPAAEWTDHALLALDHVGKVELIDGELLKMSPAGPEHEDIGSILIIALGNVVNPARLGRIYGSSAGYRMASGNLLSPDVSFISAGRLKGRRAQYKKFLKLAPDLAVEILSPDDSRNDALRKMPEYFANGARLAWIIDPDRRTVEIITHPDHLTRTLTLADTLTADPVIPHFSLKLTTLFDPPDFD